MDDDNSGFTILHIPHSSRVIPDSVRAGIMLSDEELECELLRLTDAYTDEIFGFDSHSIVAQSIVFGVNRLVVDPERFLNDDYEPMSGFGMGAIYTKTADGRTLRTIEGDFREKLIESYYKPHHGALTKAVDEAVNRHGFCFILDCHSFPSRPLPCEIDQSHDRPDICIGTDDFHTPTGIPDIAMRLFGDAGYKTDLNKPYQGALVPMDYFGNDKRVLALMIEINRSLYMDEKSGDKLPTFNAFAYSVKRLVSELVSEVKQYWMVVLASVEQRDEL